jgi:hypothetical protein
MTPPRDNVAHAGNIAIDKRNGETLGTGITRTMTVYLTHDRRDAFV